MLPRANPIRCDRGDFLLFAAPDYINSVLYSAGSYCEPLLTISRMFCEGIERPLVMDIGANLGAYAVPMAKDLLAVGGDVYAYEPQRVVFYQLCGNIILNRLPNLHAYNNALGDAEGFAEIPEINYDTNKNVGAFSLVKGFREQHGIEDSMVAGRTSKVPMITLDSLRLDRRVNFIKIDVEGFELNVLRGGMQFLEDNAYPAFLFEAWNAEWFKEGRQSLLSFVGQLGYELESLGSNDFLAQHPRSAVHVDFRREANGTINLVRTR